MPSKHRAWEAHHIAESLPAGEFVALLVVAIVAFVTLLALLEQIDPAAH